MKVNSKVIALMTALAASVAGAQTVDRTSNLTLAGTMIDNTATATFTDPSTGTAGTTVQSNKVTTTVAAKQAFNITYAAGGDNADTSTLTGAAQTTAALPGQTVAFQYVAVNNGNDTNTITLATTTSGVTAVTYYYPMSDGSSPLNVDGTVKTGAVTVPATGLVVPAEGSLQSDGKTKNTGLQPFYIVVTVPTTATPGSTVGATPVGTGEFWNSTSKTNTSTTETSTNLFLQYSAIKVQTSGSALGPNGSPEASGAADQQTNNIPDKTAQSSTFSNTVKNTGQADDTFTISSSTTGTVFKGPGGEALSTTPKTIDITPAGGGAAYPVTYVLDRSGNLIITGLKPGDSANFQNTIPVANTNSGSQTVTTTLTATSKNDPTKTDSTTNIIRTPGVTVTPTGPTGTTPGSSTDPLQPDPATCTTTTAVPVTLTIKNDGPADDAYTVSGTAPVTLSTGGTTTVTVMYYTDADHTTAIVNPVAVAAGSTVTLYGVVAVSCTASAQTINVTQNVKSPTSGVDATLPTTPITVATSGNLKVAKFIEGAAAPATANTLTAPTGYGTGAFSVAPGVPYKYAIMAKNNYNADVAGFQLTDPLNTNLEFIASGSSCEITLPSTSTATAPTCTVSATGQIVSTKTFTLPAGATVTMYINVQVK